MTFGSEVPVFDEPPVAEVALAVHIEPSADFTSAHCGAFWAEFLRDDYPTVQTQPAIPLAPEDFEGDGISTPSMYFGFGNPDVRYWFTTLDQTRLVQLQSDRLTLNWRKLNTAVYPHYDALRDELEILLRRWVDFLERDSLQPDVVQAEVTYVNHIIEGRGQFRDIADIGALLDSVDLKWPGAVGEAEFFQFEQRFKIPDLDGEPARFYVTAAPGIGPYAERMISLSLTVRGRPADKSIAAAPKWLNHAHRHLIQSFAAITAPGMRAEWKEGQV